MTGIISITIIIVLWEMHHKEMKVDVSYFFYNKRYYFKSVTLEKWFRKYFSLISWITVLMHFAQYNFYYWQGVESHSRRMIIFALQFTPSSYFLEDVYRLNASRFTRVTISRHMERVAGSFISGPDIKFNLFGVNKFIFLIYKFLFLCDQKQVYKIFDPRGVAMNGRFWGEKESVINQSQSNVVSDM